MQDSFSIAIVALLALILLSLWVVLYQLVKQQGRMLLRLDNVEQSLANGGRGVVTNGVQLQAGQGGPSGLAVGTPLAPFELPDLTGQMVALEDFRGKRVLLVHWSPGCGYCDLIAPELARLQGEFDKRNVQLLFVSYGDEEANRKLAEEHGLECPILLLKDSQPLEAFQNMGTPVAYLLDEQGQVAQPIAVGADQVPALAREAATGKSKKKRLFGNRSLSESKIEREGLKAGTPAPTFSLPDIHGRTISLEEYRGRRVLLVFTDPHCGPCDQLAPQLVQLHQQHHNNGLSLVMVGRGELEENRCKAEEHHIEFPVVLQQQWRLSKEYGIFTTPVGFLISEDGVIEKNVGVGSDQILALAREGLAVRVG